MSDKDNDFFRDTFDFNHNGKLDFYELETIHDVFFAEEENSGGGSSSYKSKKSKANQNLFPPTPSFKVESLSYDQYKEYLDRFSGEVAYWCIFLMIFSGFSFLGLIFLSHSIILKIICGLIFIGSVGSMIYLVRNCLPKIDKTIVLYSKSLNPSIREKSIKRMKRKKRINVIGFILVFFLPIIIVSIISIRSEIKYNAMADLVLEGKYNEAKKELFEYQKNNFNTDGEKDAEALIDLCYALEEYEKGNVDYAYYITSKLTFNYLTKKQYDKYTELKNKIRDEYIHLTS